MKDSKKLKKVDAAEDKAEDATHSTKRGRHPGDEPVEKGADSGVQSEGRPKASPQYSVWHEAKLEKGKHFPGKGDATHFQEANRQLHERLKQDPKFAADMEKRYPGITETVKPGPRGAYHDGPPHPSLTWHHHPKREGVLQLTPRVHHRSGGPVQETLHPDGKGGMENWGGGRGK